VKDGFYNRLSCLNSDFKNRSKTGIMKIVNFYFCSLLLLCITSNEMLANISASERAALIAFYNNTNGESWTNNSGWKTAPLYIDGFSLPGTENGWYGVTVADNRVTQLNLSSNQLMGSIPIEIGSLTNLTSLVLNNNMFYDGIPTEIGNLTSLTRLSLNGNKLSGELPYSIVNLVNLTYTDIGYNMLFTTYSNIDSFITGKDADWKSTQTIAPSSISVVRVTDTKIKVSWTPISYTGDGGYYRIQYGTVSGIYTASVQTTDKSSIEISIGDPEIEIMPNTRYYVILQTITPDHGTSGSADYNHNFLESLFSEEVNVTTSSSERTALIALYNSTNGDSWTNNSGWKTGSLDADGFANAGSEEGWYGLTVTNGHVTRLDLSNNNLTGSIPPEIGFLTNLTWLELFDNQLSGSIPTSIGNLTSLLDLGLYNNQLSGSIPAEIGNITWLKYLGLYNNQLSGSIPAEIGNLSVLEGLILFENQLTGDIPAEIWNLVNLAVLNLGDNHLTGIIPAEIRNLISIQYLGLYNNRLSGSIPEEIGDVGKFAGGVGFLNLDLQGNQLFGAIPTSIVKLNSISLNISYNMLWCPDENVLSYINEKQPNWEQSQTLPPVGITATGLSATEIKVSCSVRNNVGNNFIINYGTEPGSYTNSIQTADRDLMVPGLETTITGLFANTKYYFGVQNHMLANKDNQNELFTNTIEEVSATTALAAPTLTAPADLSTKAGTNPVLAWNVVSGAVSYDLDYATSNNFATGLQSFTDITATSKSLSGLIINNTYFWRVRAVNADGLSAWSEIRSFTALQPAPAGTIIGTTKVCQGQTSLTYMVPPIANASSYIWTLPSGSTGTNMGDSISVNYGTSAVSGEITVKGYNSSGNGPESALTITVNNKPGIPSITQNGNLLLSDAVFGNQWFNLTGLINSATNQIYTLTSDGIYHVIVTINGCSSDPSNSINAVLTGSEMTKDDVPIKVYPNPFSKILVIEIEGGTDKTEFEIINSKGQKVFSDSFFEKTVVETDDFSPGIYFIKIGCGKTYKFKKIIK
jgi:Leucine-rich repeat (LRR) protein